MLVFNELGESELLKIIRAELSAIQDRLSERDIEICINKSVEKHILNQIKMCPPSKLTTEDTRYFDSSVYYLNNLLYLKDC